jgi:hypothetical protein
MNLCLYSRDCVSCLALQQDDAPIIIKIQEISLKTFLFTPYLGDYAYVCENKNDFYVAFSNLDWYARELSRDHLRCSSYTLD